MKENNPPAKQRPGDPLNLLSFFLHPHPSMIIFEGDGVGVEKKRRFVDDLLFPDALRMKGKKGATSVAVYSFLQ